MSRKRSDAATGLMAAILAFSLAGCNDNSASNPQNDTILDKAGGVVGLNGKGAATTRDFKLANFTAVELAGSDDVTLRQGAEFQIRARGPASAIEQLDLRVENGVLRVGRKNSAGVTTGKVEFNIVLPQLNGAKVTGSGDLDADALAGDEVELTVTGSGDLKIASLTAKKASLLVTGSGELEVKGGQIEAGTYKVTGSGDLDAEKLNARTLSISVAGSGDLDALASGKADVQILGSGDVTVKGGATCSTKILGSGKATCI